MLAAERLLERTGASHVVEVMRTKVGFPRALFDGGVLPLVNAYAEFVQLLPALTPRRGEEAGGLLLHGVEAALAALDFRRGQILPRGAAPEAIGAQHYRWTYAVLVAALLHEIERPFSGLRVFARRADREPELWLPMAGSLGPRAGSSYRWECVASPVDDASTGKLALFLFDRFVPLGMIEWLSVDAQLVRELLNHLGGEPAAEHGALRGLASRAVAYAAGVDRPPVAPAESQRADAAPPPSTVSGSPPASEAQVSEPEFLDPVDDPAPAPRRRKAR